MTNLFPYNIPTGQARTLFLDTLFQVQSMRLPLPEVRNWCEAQARNLDQQWPALESLAREALIEQLGIHLEVFLRAWAYFRSLEWVLNSGSYLDPASPAVSNDVERELLERLTLWSSQLLICWQQGEQEREQAQRAQQRTADQDWQNIAFQLFREHRTSWELDHQIGQTWANIASDGVKKAQEGAKEMYSFAAATQAHVVGAMNALQQHMEQKLPLAIEQAQSKRRTGLLKAILIVCGVGLGLFVLACVVGPTIIGHP